MDFDVPRTDLPRLHGKPMSLLLTAGGEGIDNADLVFRGFHHMVGLLRARSAGTWLVPNCTEPEALGEDVRRHAAEFARTLLSKIASLGHCPPRSRRRKRRRFAPSVSTLTARTERIETMSNDPSEMPGGDPTMVPQNDFELPVEGFQGTPEEIERQWFEQVYTGRGDSMLQLTWRAV